MHDDNRLAVLAVRAIVQISGQYVVLLHSLEEETGIKAELEDFLDVCHIVVWKGEPAQAEVLDGLLWVGILLLSA